MEFFDKLRQFGFSARIVFLTLHDYPGPVGGDACAGAREYALKTRIAVEPVLAIRETAAKCIAISPPFGFGEWPFRHISQFQITHFFVRAQSLT